MNLRTGRMKVHRPAGAPVGTGARCSASDMLMVQPDPPELVDDEAARDSYCCPECGRDVKVSDRSGLLYSHNLPGRADPCPGSGRGVRAGNPAAGAVVEIKRMDKPKARRQPRPVQSCSSVYAIPAGLPSTGRRRK